MSLSIVLVGAVLVFILILESLVLVLVRVLVIPMHVNITAEYGHFGLFLAL